MKRKTIRSIRLANVLLAFSCCLSSCSCPREYNSSKEAAIAGLRFFKEGVRQAPDPTTPFASNAAIDAVLLVEPPIPVFRIYRSELGAFTGAAAVLPLIGDTIQLVYPFVASGAIKGCAVVDKNGSKYRLVAVGGRTWIQPVINARQSAALFWGIPARQLFLVRIPAINVDLIGGKSGAGLNLEFVDPSQRTALAPQADSSSASILSALSVLATSPDTNAR